MVNNINSVAFKVNYNVLDFILKNNLKYKFYTDPNYIHPLTHNSKLTKKEKEDLDSFNSKKDLEQNILGLATIKKQKKNKKVDSFYIQITTRLDYRGRLYCISEYFKYQSIDYAKSLLQFSKEEEVKLTDETAIAIDFLKYLVCSYGQLRVPLITSLSLAQWLSFIGPLAPLIFIFICFPLSHWPIGSFYFHLSLL